MDALKLVLLAIMGYLLGSINTSLVVGKFYGVDVRKHGSGNAGATNTLRTLGKKAAIIATLGDVFKGIIACVIGRIVLGDSGLMIAGIAAIIGHNWPIYFKFKGGKGVLTTMSVVIMMDWKISLILLAIFAVIVAITRFVSLGSMVGAGLFPIVGFMFGHDTFFIIIAGILAILVITRHQANIKRLINGNESKLGSKKKENPQS